MSRISKEDYFLKIAEVIAQRSPCLKMQVGAIIVKDDCILSTGYNGPPRGEPHCIECSRMDKKSGSEYTICPAVHAEENCIINAARYGICIKEGTLYLWTSIKNLEPCYRCKRALKNAGINNIIIRRENDRKNKNSR